MIPIITSNKSLFLQTVINLKNGGEIVYKRKQWQPEGKNIIFYDVNERK